MRGLIPQVPVLKVELNSERLPCGYFIKSRVQSVAGWPHRKTEYNLPKSDEENIKTIKDSP